MEICPCSLLTLLLFVSILLNSSRVLVHGVDVFSEALLSLKSEIVDDTNSLSDWVLPQKDDNLQQSRNIQACSWTGIKCNTNSTLLVAIDLSRMDLSGKLSGNQFPLFSTHLVELNLSQNSFSGHLPLSIFNLTNLKTLDISRNNFSGRFPNGSSGLKNLVVFDAFSNSFSGPLPADLSRIETLKVLNLAGSYFNGSIPSEFGDFKSLEFIHLAGNFLSGYIPPQLGKLQTLTHMEIGYNSYNGGIPREMGNMTRLQYLDIAGASVTGSIPKELSNLTELESLFLFRNQLDGVIPSDFGNLVSLRSLDLSDNHISGPIPESFIELKNISLLSLMYNEMNGTIPEAIAELPMLETLLIWNNFFTGSLPINLGKNSKQLNTVDVSTNEFSGSIPSHICAGGMLSKLIIFSNNFSGELPVSLANCSSLVRIRFEDNSLSGSIPFDFSNLPVMSYVDLSRNQFTGGIPDYIIFASKLEYFNVSHNPVLGGAVPRKLWSLPVLSNFSASSCNISGDLPSFESCKSVSVIELNENGMSGIIPETVSDCEQLLRIDLSNNELTGQIPEKLASLPALGIIDLSYNNLTGIIPQSFSHSSNQMVLLNVSFNDLSGSVPNEKVFRLMGSSAFVGNPKLCGAPLDPCPNSTKEIQAEFLWVLVLCAAVVAFIALSVSGIFYFHKGRRLGQWKMVSFPGLPQFTANEVLKSFNSSEHSQTMPAPFLVGSIHKAVLPTGITVSVKMIEWAPQQTVKAMTEFITQMGNDARHKNLTRLLGYCYSTDIAYLLFDNYLSNGNLAEKLTAFEKRDWSYKYRVVIGVAEGLHFLHHECHPAIPHGDLRLSNIVFDENMEEPRLAEFGFKYLIRLGRGELDATVKEELIADIYSFGEVIFEILTDGRVGKSMRNNKSMEFLMEEICNENDGTQEEEVKLMLEVASLCTRSRMSDRPTMEQVMKLLRRLR